MINTQRDLRALMAQGHTIARMADFGGSGRFRWTTTADGESVTRRVLSAMIRKGGVQVIASDMCGDPMQYGPPA